MSSSPPAAKKMRLGDTDPADEKKSPSQTEIAKSSQNHTPPPEPEKTPAEHEKNPAEREKTPQEPAEHEKKPAKPEREAGDLNKIEEKAKAPEVDPQRVASPLQGKQLAAQERARIEEKATQIHEKLQAEAQERAGSEAAREQVGSRGSDLEGTELDPTIIDGAFAQIQMCDEDDESFSRSIVFKYFEQAEETIPKLRDLFASQTMKSLSETGHFLKSSSAVMGIRKVREACEKVQHYALLKDLKGAPLTHEQAIELLDPIIKSIEDLYLEAKRHLMRLYK